MMRASGCTKDPGDLIAHASSVHIPICTDEAIERHAGSASLPLYMHDLLHSIHSGLQRSGWIDTSRQNSHRSGWQRFKLDCRTHRHRPSVYPSWSWARGADCMNADLALSRQAEAQLQALSHSPPKDKNLVCEQSHAKCPQISIFVGK